MLEPVILSPKSSEILNAAQDLIQERGFNGFSFRDIAAKVGIRSASIHYHYPTKTELASAVTAHYRAMFQDKLDSLQTADLSQIEKLRAYGELFVATLRESNKVCLCGVLASEAETLPIAVRNEVRQFFDAQHSWLIKVIEEGKRSNEIRASLNSASFSSSFIAALEGAMIIARSVEEPQRLKQTLDQHIDFLQA
jgi:TetR/AcrR family transcriptional regulator, transcriptional repressor for nem operon